MALEGLQNNSKYSSRPPPSLTPVDKPQNLQDSEKAQMSS